MIQRHPTRPTLRQRFLRSDIGGVILFFVVLYGFILAAELLCWLVGAGFDPRAGA